MSAVAAPGLRSDPLRAVAVAVGVVTAVSGLALLVLPSTALDLVGAGTDDPAPYLFRVVGMMMLLFGGLLTDAGRRAEPPAVALLWCGLQKVGASVAMAAGVIAGVYGALAVGVALFDGAGAVVVLALWRRQLAREAS